MPAKPKLEDNDRLPDSSRGEVLIYQTDDGQINLDVRLENETLWLTQQMMADLFQSAKQYIGQHLKNILDESEFNQSSVVKKSFTTAASENMQKG